MARPSSRVHAAERDTVAIELDRHDRGLRAEREAERIFEMSPALLAVAGFDGYLRRFNPAFALFGYSAEELLSRPWIEFAHPDDRARMQDAAASLAGGSDVVQLENRVVCADGSVRWVQWSTRVVPEESLFFVAGRDMTDARRAADEQAALRRVATLVARETPPDAVLAAVAREVGEVLGAGATHLGKFDPDGTVLSVAQWPARTGVAVGARFPLEGDSVSTRVLRTGRPARMDDYSEATGTIAATVRGSGIRGCVGVPISVEGRTWGVMIVSTRAPEPFAPETEARLHGFTDLLATAISNASAHERLRRLAEQQAALTRVATLVARETPHAELFAAIAEEIGRLVGVDSIEMLRYEDGGFAAAAAGWGPVVRAVPDGGRMALGGRNVATLVFETGRTARLDGSADASGPIGERLRAGGVSSTVGAPIFVESRLWGVMIAASVRGPVLPPDTDVRIGRFTELMATAIAKAEARAVAERLTGEQAALRRVATLVAQGASPPAVFDAVTAEVRQLLHAEAVSLARYDGDVLLVLAHNATQPIMELGQRIPMQPADITAIVQRTGRSARRDDAPSGRGAIAGILQRGNVHSTVAVPVVVDGRTWGVMGAAWPETAPPPEDTEARMTSFAELLDTAIANADSRAQLTASRARMLAAGDEARRRVVRDLHDGAQQRLVHSIVTLKLARRALRDRRPEAEALVAAALGHAEDAIAALRDLSYGILPVGLMRGGLLAAIDALVSRMRLSVDELDVTVDVDVALGRLPRDMEASAYFIVAEALTNVVKHAQARHAWITVAVDAHDLCVEVRDDGVGGADPGGFGLVGIADRADALGGELTIAAADGGGTVVAARLPLSA